MHVLLFALPLSLLFVTLSDQWTLDGFLVGYVIGAAVMLLIAGRRHRVRGQRLPSQLFWFGVYFVKLSWNIFLSGFDVARRVLDPRLPINPGTVAIPVQDEKRSLWISALSAHAITVTPGEMVEGFIEIDGRPHFVIHTLDVAHTERTGHQAQAARLKMLRRITGEDDKS
jgi:multicomponent Na+:H+ antiporter subunit E